LKDVWTEPGGQPSLHAGFGAKPILQVTPALSFNAPQLLSLVLVAVMSGLWGRFVH
jgi:hypothetical protein